MNVYIFITDQNTKVQTRIYVSILVYMGKNCYLTKVKAKEIIMEKLLMWVKYSRALFRAKYRLLCIHNP